MLALATCVLCTNLLAIYTLYRQTLMLFVSLVLSMRQMFAPRTLSSSLARNSTKAACTSSSGGAGKLEVEFLDFGFGV